MARKVSLPHVSNWDQGVEEANNVLQLIFSPIAVTCLKCKYIFPHTFPSTQHSQYLQNRVLNFFVNDVTILVSQRKTFKLLITPFLVIDHNHQVISILTQEHFSK